MNTMLSGWPRVLRLLMLLLMMLLMVLLLLLLLLSLSRGVVILGLGLLHDLRVLLLRDVLDLIMLR